MLIRGVGLIAKLDDVHCSEAAERVECRWVGGVEELFEGGENSKY